MKKIIFALIFILLVSIITISCSNDNGAVEINEHSENNLSEDNQIENIAEEIKNFLPQELIRTHDEKYNRYNFAYKRNTLSIRKEIFDERLTDEHIRKFFDGAEIMYDKLSAFFPENDLPEIFAYHAVPPQWGSEPGLYDDYSDIAAIAGAWADPWLNATFYYENNFAIILSMIDIGFPRIVCHEVGHLFTMYASAPRQYYNAPYVWDSELFAELAVYYLASEMTVINAFGEIVTTYGEQDLFWGRFFSLVEKYGYKLISDTFKEMVTLAADDTRNDSEAAYNLFKQVLSQKTGDDVDYFILNPGESIINIQGRPYDTTFTRELLLNSANLEDSDIEPLRYMVNLTRLQLVDNQISNISNIATLSNLTSLALSGNQINDVSALAGLTNLSELFLNNNKISDISVLTGLTSLTLLILDNNQINEVSALKDLKNLTVLALRDNPISTEQITELRQALPNTEIHADY
jgi:hypothetical protein